MAILIALMLTISTSSILLLPTTTGHTPAWTTTSYSYHSVAPDPVGVGQTVAVCMWVDTAMPSAAVENDIRRHDYKLTIIAPNGETEVKTWDVISDSTGVQFYRYTPTQVGNYTFTFNYPQQTYTWSGVYQNDTFLASSRTQTLIVQQEPLPSAVDSYPLPTEYWTRPIEGQNNYWYTIASNWLGQPYIIGAGSAYIGGEQPDGSAPTSAHIMWTKPIDYGGVVGGNQTAIPGEGYYQGLSYNPRFTNSLIMQGLLYYQEPWGNAGTGGDYVAVDLRTGQEQWRVNTTATGTSLVPSFGYLYSFETPNQHGVLPNGLLVATSGSTWRAYDARTGVLTTMNITNVPSGSDIAGPQGEFLRYTLTNYGNSTVPKYNIMQWNSSNVFGKVSGTGVGAWYSGTANASAPGSWDWNVSLTLPPGTWTIGTACRGLVPLISLDNVLLLTQGTFGGHISDSGATVTSDPGNITAISLKPNEIGRVIWTQTYQPAPGNNTRFISAWDPTNGVFVFSDKESFANWGYSLTTGQYMWGPSYPPNTGSVDWNYMIWYTPFCQYGNLYSAGFSGLLYCFDDLTGELKWTYGNGGSGNSTSSGFITPYGYYPEFVECVADGKIYLVGNEHSPNSPMYKDSQLRCINASNGAELWTIMGWGNMMSGSAGVVADGYLSVFDPYDGQIYTYGKGPSAITISAPDLAASFGQSVVIRGTVTDIAAGTKQTEQAARFPNGVPAVSDASQSAWMEYVYMQKPMPTTATGVPVSIDVVDSNGNFRNIGSTTSDANGVFSFTWTPDIQGSYSVIATFKGSESYYPSHAETSFAVMGATPTPSPEPVAAAPAPVEMYFVGSTIAIIIAVAIATLLIIKKK
jgi:hypothetical protein